jgi:TPR repeat protein
VCTDTEIANRARLVARRRSSLKLTIVQRQLSAILLVAFAGLGTPSIAHADALARGTAAYARGDYNRAARELEPLARRGNARALALLGFLYEHGLVSRRLILPRPTFMPRAPRAEIPSPRPCSD